MKLRTVLVAVGVGVFVFTSLGVGARATYGARTTADEPQYLLTALSLYEDGDLDIANQRYSGAYRDFHEAALPVQSALAEDGSRVSPHNPLLPILLAVPTGVGGWVAAKLAMAAMAAGLASLLVWIGVRRLALPVGLTSSVVVVFAVSPPLAIYATQIYPEIPAALAVTVAIAALTGRPSLAGTVSWLAAVITLPWLAVKYVPVAAVLAIAGLWWQRHPARRVTSATVLMAAAAGYVAFNLVVYGGLTPYASGDFFVAGEFTAIGSSPDYLGRAQRLGGLMVDRGFGLAAWQPAYLLAVPAVAWSIRSHRRDLHLVTTLLATGWLVATFVAQTMHGWWWPGRQVVVVLPAAVLVIAAWSHVSAHHRIHALIGWVGVVSFVAVVVEATFGRVAMIVDFTLTANPLYRAWSSLLPDYLAPSGWTWVLHGVWVVIIAALAWRGWSAVPERHNARLARQRDDVRVP